MGGHGSDAGIITRFFLQMLDLAKMAYLSTGVNPEPRFNEFLEKNIKDFHHFYDLRNEVETLYLDYMRGLREGEYFYIEQGTERLDRGPEVKLQNAVRQFFMFTDVLLRNFNLSKVITDDHFDLNRLLFVKDEKFEKTKAKLLENCPIDNYKILFRIVEDFRTDRYADVIGIRNEFQHEGVTLGKFGVELHGKELIIVEPQINKRHFLDSVNLCYQYVFDFIETIMAYYFGIVGMHNNKVLGFFEKENYDFTNGKQFRYVLLPNIGFNGLKPLFT